MGKNGDLNKTLQPILEVLQPKFGIRKVRIPFVCCFSAPSFCHAELVSASHAILEPMKSKIHEFFEKKNTNE
jgi:hypothetical protein